MHRKYRPRHYADRILKARGLMPDAAIGADVMAGFPGETDAEFEENRAFIERLPFTYLHVFTYSERPGTAAAAMPDPVPMPGAQRSQPHIARTGGAEESGIPPPHDRSKAFRGHARRTAHRAQQQLSKGATSGGASVQPVTRSGDRRIDRRRSIRIRTFFRLLKL